VNSSVTLPQSDPNPGDNASSAVVKVTQFVGG